jgi:5'-nucleotidase
MRILLTNDDGIAAEGLRALETALAALACRPEIYTCAPREERSAASHSISLRKGCRFEQIAERRWAVDGTPADTVILALSQLLPARPDLVISGINHGNNLGKNIHYSGTVSAAAEGVLNGIESLAVSIAGRGPYDFPPTARLVAALVERLQTRPIPAGHLLNINVPAAWNNGVRPTRAYRHYARTTLIPLEGKEGYWFNERIEYEDVPPDADYLAVREGSVSVSLEQVFVVDGNYSGYLASLDLGGLHCAGLR